MLSGCGPCDPTLTRFIGRLLASAYFLAVFLWMLISLAIARMERPRSLVCYTAFHSTCCRGVGLLSGDVARLRARPMPLRVSSSAELTSTGSRKANPPS